MRKALAPAQDLHRHRHRDGYIAVVLSGGYLELGDRGAQRLSPGDAIVHYPFEAHRNLADRQGAELINIPLTTSRDRGHRFLVRDPDALVRALEKKEDAERLFWSDADGAPDTDAVDWVELAAARLSRLDTIGLADLAAEIGIHPESFTRTFTRRFGVTPHRYREECRVQRAAMDLIGSTLSLAQVACKHGFSDQAHMTRNVAALSGQTPGQLRSQ